MVLCPDGPSQGSGDMCETRLARLECSRLAAKPGPAQKPTCGGGIRGPNPSRVPQDAHRLFQGRGVSLEPQTGAGLAVW